jgi:hypothetical protein
MMYDNEARIPSERKIRICLNCPLAECDYYPFNGTCSAKIKKIKKKTL